MNDVNTWMTPCGEWKAQLAGPIFRGTTREEAIQKAGDYVHSMQAVVQPTEENEDQEKECTK